MGFQSIWLNNFLGRRNRKTPKALVMISMRTITSLHSTLIPMLEHALGI